MKGLLHRKRQQEVETVRADDAREVAEIRAETIDATRTASEHADPADVKRIVVGPPGCCCVTERPVRKQPAGVTSAPAR